MFVICISLDEICSWVKEDPKQQWLLKDKSVLLPHVSVGSLELMCWLQNDWGFRLALSCVLPLSNTQIPSCGSRSLLSVQPAHLHSKWQEGGEKAGEGMLHPFRTLPESCVHHFCLYTVGQNKVITPVAPRGCTTMNSNLRVLGLRRVWKTTESLCHTIYLWFLCLQN